MAGWWWVASQTPSGDGDAGGGGGGGGDCACVQLRLAGHAPSSVLARSSTAVLTQHHAHAASKMFSTVTVTCALLLSREASASSTLAALYSDDALGVRRDAVETAFKEVYDHFAGAFDTSLYDQFASNINASLASYKQSPAYTAYALYPTAPHCDRGVATPVPATPVGGVSAYPGGAVGRVFGFDFGKQLLELSENANGPASAGLIAPMALSRQALSTGMGLVQSSVAAMLHVVPPLVPPPLWNNQPMTCVPMVSGHNCFGAVTYPITMADFMLADVWSCTVLSCFVSRPP